MREFDKSADPITEFERMLLDGTGLRLVQDHLGPEATKEDALREHRRLRRIGRTLSKCLSELP